MQDQKPEILPLAPLQDALERLLAVVRQVQGSAVSFYQPATPLPGLTLVVVGPWRDGVVDSNVSAPQGVAYLSRNLETHSQTAGRVF